MKKFFQLFITVAMLATVGACSKDDDGPDDDAIWDIVPVEVRIQLVDKEGNNLLDPAVDGNMVGEIMWIKCNDETYDAIWKKEDIQPFTRMIMPVFYGTVWTGVWRDGYYELEFGEFSGTTSHDMKLMFGITSMNKVYEFEFSHRLVWKKKEPHFDDHITYQGQRIEGRVLKLVLDKN